MLSIWAERTDITGVVMYEAMSGHLIFPLASLSSFTSRAAFDGTIVWPVR